MSSQQRHLSHPDENPPGQYLKLQEQQHVEVNRDEPIPTSSLKPACPMCGQLALTSRPAKEGRTWSPMPTALILPPALMTLGGEGDLRSCATNKWMVSSNGMELPVISARGLPWVSAARLRAFDSRPLSNKHEEDPTLNLCFVYLAFRYSLQTFLIKNV